MDIDLLRKAEDLALAAHAGQTDKTGAPFSDHLRRVADRVGGREQKMVAYLHDIVEKGEGWTLARLAGEGFPQSVIDAVDAMTRRPGEDYVDFVRRAISNPLARPVKRADLEDNLRQAERTGAEGEKYRAGLALFPQPAGERQPPDMGSC